MKKIVSIFIGMLWAASVMAVTYGNPYTGSGRSGYATGTYHRQASSAGFAKTPSAAMRSTSAMYGTMSAGTASVVSSTMQVQGFYTSAAGVRGGVTSGETYSGMGSRPRRVSGPGSMPDLGSGTCEDLNGDGKCDHCGHEFNEFDECCTLCEEESGYCWCPIGDGWDVWLMLAVVAAGYVMWRRRREAAIETGN